MIARPRSRTGLARVIALVLMATPGATGCSRSPLSATGVNLPPQLEIVDARAPSPHADVIRVRWSARDPDGRLASIRWTTAPFGGVASPEARLAGSEREWLIPTARTAARVGQSATREPQLLTLWAVDERGAASEPAKLAYFAQNVAPTVSITSPQPSPALASAVRERVCISWAGSDPDGIFTNRPVKYIYRMLDADDPQNAVFLSDPDSLRRQDAPNNWQGWDSTSAETTFTRYQNLTPGKSYLFAVTGFDEAGDYDPVFRRDKNVLHIRVQLEETGGPDLLVQAPGLFQFSEGGWADDPASAIRCEVAAGRPLRVRLVAQPTGGLDLLGHRWVLDPVDPDDETPRAGPDDFAHWSPWTSEPVIDLGVQGGASFKRSVHRLYFQVRTGHGGCNGFEGDFVSKGLFEYVVVRATMNRELLIVDDTRLQVDRHDPNDGALLPYTGPWPSATELDTFLYARGGVPWHGTFNPPAGVLSSPGLFAGFAFDTLGTRGLRTGFGVTEPINSSRLDGTVPLSVLADYRHVIWLTDPLATVFSSPVDDPLSPMSTLRHMSSARERNVLSTYSDMGGKLWLVGATATAACMPWDRTQNNSPVPRFSASQGELSEGRMPWDAVHLRSEVARASGTTVTRSLGRFSADPGLFGPLPTALDRRNVTFDPLPPTRFSVSQFNVNSFFVETISLPNSIIEDLDPDPEFGLIASTLDSIYSASGNTVPGTLPAMALYHGSDNGQVLWSGFDIWSFKRADCAAIVNWVLQDLWGLTPSPQPNQPTAAPRSGRRTATVVPDRRVTVPAARPVSR